MISWESMTTIATATLAGYTALVVGMERLRGNTNSTRRLSAEQQAFAKEVRSYLDTLNISIREHIVIQQVTTTTLSGLVTRLESLNERVNRHETDLAIIKDREIREKR